MSAPTVSLHYAASRLLAYLDLDSGAGIVDGIEPVLLNRPSLAFLVEELRDALDRVEVES